MGNVYRAHTGPDLLAWSERTVPHTAEARIQGITSAINITATLDKLQQSRAMYPIELQAAQLKSQLLQSEVRRAEVMNSSKMLDLAAKDRMLQLRLQTQIAEKELKGNEVLSEFNEAYASKMEKALALGDYQTVADLTEEQAQEYGEYAPYLTKSPYWGPNVTMRLDERSRQNFDRLQREVQAERIAKLRKVRIQMKDIQDMKARLEHEWADKTEVNQMLGGIDPREVGMGGERNSDPDTLRKAIMNYSKIMIDRLSDADAKEYKDDINFFETLKNMAKHNYKRDLLPTLTPKGLRRKVSNIASHKYMFEKQSTQDAINFASSLMYLARGMDTDNQEQRDNYLNEFIQLIKSGADITVSGAEARELTEKYKYLERQEQAAIRELGLYAPSVPPRVVRYERGAGYGEPTKSKSVPPDEAIRVALENTNLRKDFIAKYGRPPEEFAR
jgi:hypothetical protein